MINEVFDIFRDIHDVYSPLDNDFDAISSRIQFVQNREHKRQYLIAEEKFV